MILGDWRKCLMNHSHARPLLMTMALAVAAAASAQTPAPAAPPAPAMVLTVSEWADGDPIPVKFTQAGEQVSPEMKWTNVPKGTVTFLLHMHDPDVARNKTTDTQV